MSTSNKPTILSQNKSRSFTLVSSKYHLTGCSSMNGGMPSRANPPYTLTFATSGAGTNAQALTLSQAEEVFLSIEESRKSGTVKNITVTADNINLTDTMDIIKNISIAEYRTENISTVKTIDAHHLESVKRELEAQSKLQQLLQGLTRNVQSLSLKECEHVQSVLEPVL